MDWNEAKRYLDFLIQEYESIGWMGKFGLELTLYPLRKRFNNGERTESLYNEIMECE